MHSTASPTRIGGCILVNQFIPQRPHQKWLSAPWWNTALTWDILSYLTSLTTWLRYLTADLAHKGSNRHPCTIPSRKHRLASLEQSQKPLIDSLKQAGRHFSPPRLSLPPEITLLYLHLSQKMGSVSSPNIHLPWHSFLFPFLTLPNSSCDKDTPSCDTAIVYHTIHFLYPIVQTRF